MAHERHAIQRLLWDVMSTEHPEPARSFGAVADAYDRGRPTYPREAAVWLTSDQPLCVLELGAGTGKLTEQLVALGHDVHATEPDPAMLAILAKKLPDVRVSQAPAEEIPSGDAAYDVVVSGQAFHWFDLDRALPEIARVLKPHGRLSVVWNERDERIPWVKRLGRLIGTQEQNTDPTQDLLSSHLFGFVESARFRFWQPLDRDRLRDLVLSRSTIATMAAAEREEVLAQVDELYDGYGRGADGMLLPYRTHCFKAVVRPQPEPEPVPGRSLTPPPGDDDTDALLIDFQ
jgi:ubiquinone/menaquinone biosynthesis C-methylase UbiE